LNKAESSVIWLLAGALATAGVAWVAFQVQQDGVAPAVVFPVVVGAVVGGTIAALGRTLAISRRYVLVIGAVFWGMLVVLGQDYVGHRERVRRYADELAGQSPLAALTAEGAKLRPTFADYLARKVEAQPVWWTLDFLLTAVAAGAVAAACTRSPVIPLATPLANHGRLGETESS
jgi:hypothetical protein